MRATIPQVAATMQHVLGPVANIAARATGFIRRPRKLTGATFVQTLVFGWLSQPQASLERLSQVGASLGVDLTPQGWDARFTPQAAACRQQVLEAAVAAVITAPPTTVPLLRRFAGGVWLQDSSLISLPAALAAVWPGCGGSTGPTAALTLPVRTDLLAGALDGPRLQPGRAQDRTRPHQAAPLPPGALRLADGGSFCLAEVRRRDADGTCWVTKLQAGTIIFTADGRRWTLLARLEQRGAATVDEWVEWGVRERLPARLIAVRVPQEVADQRRRRLREQAQRDGKTPSREQLARCAWTVLVTNVPAARLSVREALVLARARWQIELLFKLWKSHHQIDAWRSRQPWRSLCEVYAKLLGAVIQHWLLLVGCWHYPDRSLAKAALAVQSHALALALAVAGGRRAAVAAVLTAIRRALRHHARVQPRASRPALFQLLLALEAAAAEGAPPPPMAAAVVPPPPDPVHVPSLPSEKAA